MSQIKIGLIGGTGLGQALGAEREVRRHEIDTPFGQPSDAILETQWAGLPLLILSRHGPGHVLNPSQVPSRANIFALKMLGCTHIIASGAVGSLRDDLRPRDLVIPDQIIDKTYRRPGTFFERAAVHVELAEPFCPVLRQILIEAGRDTVALSAGASSGGSGAAGSTGTPFAVHDGGCYVCMEGPAFSTRAESLMHRLWGGDLIGMTAMPEAKLAREAEIAYALVALVTDYDCWRNRPATASESAAARSHEELLKEILANLQAATDHALRLIRRAVELMAGRQHHLASPAHHALELGIWSDRSRIPADEVQRLAPLWIKYLEAVAEPSPGAPGEGTVRVSSD